MTADIYWIWLCTLPGIGPVRAHKLLELFGDPQRIYHTEKATFLQHGLKDTDWLQTILEEKNLDTAKRIYDNCWNHDILLLTIYDQSYPQALRAIPELPVLLYYKGKLKSDIRGMGIVGARRCTQDDKKEAIRIATACSKNDIPVISGMAKGIDAYAHTAVLREGGYPVAFLGSGADICYPSEHRGLMAEIINNGVVISEYPPCTAPRPYHFPRRNRLIAAWSKELYVIGAGRNSGTRYTLDYYNKYHQKKGVILEREQ